MRTVDTGKVNQVADAGTIAGGRFRLIKAIGKGGMGTVWWARHELIGRDVALKLSSSFCRQDQSVRFQREAQIIGKFQHRNIVSILDAGECEEQGCYFLAMELLRGRPFSDRFTQGTPLAPEEVLPILIDVCRGLEAAHAAGVVHRDIKPENIFLAEVPGEGTVAKILDFGISKTVDASITIDGQILGTPAYMAPEQATGARDITPAVDIWAVGVMLYEALSGKQPFPGGDYRYLLLSILEEEPDPLPTSVDAPIRAIVSRCLQKDPAARYPSARRLRDDLERALAQRIGATLLSARSGHGTMSSLPTMADMAPFTATVENSASMAQSAKVGPSARPRLYKTSICVFAAACVAACITLFAPEPAAAPGTQLHASVGSIAQKYVSGLQHASQDESIIRGESAAQSETPAGDERGTAVAELELPGRSQFAGVGAGAQPTAAPKTPASPPRRAFVTRINNPGF